MPAGVRCRSLIRWQAAGLAVAVAFAISACGQQPSAATYHPTLAYTRWVPDPRAMAGPEPGYKPEFTGLTDRDVLSATAAIDASGSAWLIDVTFTPRGRQLFAALTKANVEACPGDPDIALVATCVQRHLAIWLDLTQTDLDTWDEPGHAARISGPFDLKCLASHPGQRVCAKLVSDPVTLEEITGGVAQISGSFTQQTATQLADAFDTTPR